MIKTMIPASLTATRRQTNATNSQARHLVRQTYQNVVVLGGSTAGDGIVPNLLES